MALIKCSECGKEISDKAKTCVGCGAKVIKKEKKFCKECGTEIQEKEEKCSKCGCPVKHNKSKKNIIIVISLITLILISILIFFLINSSNKLVCIYSNSNDVGIIEYRITYKFKNGKIKSLKGYQYAKPSNKQIAESLWEVSNKQQDQYNYYEGLSYKATFSEDSEITLNYSIDAEKAPNMFKSIAGLTGIEGINAKLTKDELKEIYEKNDYICK